MAHGTRELKGFVRHDKGKGVWREIADELVGDVATRRHLTILVHPLNLELGDTLILRI